MAVQGRLLQIMGPSAARLLSFGYMASVVLTSKHILRFHQKANMTC